MQQSFCWLFTKVICPMGVVFPLQWQVLAYENKITVSLLKVSKDYDARFIYSFNKLDGTELYDELRYKQAKAYLI